MLESFFYQAGRVVVRTYARLMLRLNLSFHSPFPVGPKIIVANHPTTTDPFILTGIHRGTSAVLIKDLLFDIPLFGRYLTMSGHIPVDRENGALAFQKALSALKRGITVIVFIEGDLSTTLEKLKKPKTGAVRLALKSGFPIVPIGISVEKKRIKKLATYIKGVKDWGKWYFRGKYCITIGKPIHLTGNPLQKKSVIKSTQGITEKIKKLIAESSLRLAR